MADDHPSYEWASNAPPGGTEAEWEFIDRYVAGECSPEEATRVETLLAARPDLAGIVAALRAALEADPQAGSAVAWDADAGSARLARTIAGETGASHRAPPALGVVVGRGERRTFDLSARLSAARRIWVAAAAAVLLAVGGGLFWTNTHIRSGRESVTPVTSMREVATQRGQRAVFNLSDGTRVILAAESNLRVPAGYNTPAAGGRPVYLDGQAHFAVHHDSTLPFEVRTPAGVAQDLGTEFVVAAYPETNGMRVAVSEGLVALHPRWSDSAAAPQGAPAPAPPILTLVPGDLGSLDSAGVATVTHGADLRPYLAWTEGSLVFNGTPLRDALRELGRWYDLDVRLEDASLAGRRLTATFTNEAAPQVLERIALILHLEARWQGKVVTLAADSSGSRS